MTLLVRCSRCKEDKTESDYAHDRTTKTGRCCYCRACRSEYGRAYRQNNPEWVRRQKEAAKRWRERRPEHYHMLVNARATAYRRRLKAEFLTEYGGKCRCCGEIEPDFLTLEHINHDGPAHRAACGGAGTVVLADLKRKSWPKEGYEILCMNCNYATRLGAVCPHQRKSERSVCG